MAVEKVCLEYVDLNKTTMVYELVTVSVTHTERDMFPTKNEMSASV